MSDAVTIVIFGASGDLTARKLVPALFDNFQKDRLPQETSIVGVSRTEMSDDTFRDRLFEHAQKTLGDACDEACWREFAQKIHYHPGDVTQMEACRKLDDALGQMEADDKAGRLYYLALAPQLFEAAVENLAESGLSRENGNWRRVVFEKPFGHDLESARALNEKIRAGFDESQIFRIDHYLGKETVQNVLALRFGNTIFEPLWNRNFIDHVQITVAEANDVGTRGDYYDRAGVLRDMFQNHLLQVLTLVAMEPPARFEAGALRDEKVKILEAVRIPHTGAVFDQSVVAQYEGYRGTDGVNARSRTPTFAALKLGIDTWRWQSVPFYLRSGKALPAKSTEVIIQFLCPPHMIFDIPKGERLQCNQLVLSIQPEEGVHLSFQTKVPDAGMKLRESQLSYFYADSYPQQNVPDAYERLLLDAIRGDATLFIREDEIIGSWNIIDPVIKAWEQHADEPLPTYRKDTWGPDVADELIARDGRQWVNRIVQPDE
jgi:glucose-6-phosphate 1-dehydrogenase